jgi:UDP-2,3-diacylglucosamine hydrolase
MTRALFISDLHLCPSRPELFEDFIRFMEGPARDCDALYILGDLFEYWIGDDDLADPFNASVADALSKLASGGPQIFFMAGNRDFLIGPLFAQRARLKLLDDGTVIELNGQRVALCHGDTLCTDDLDYQRFRSMVRAASWQQRFLSQPLQDRRAQVEDMRRQSELSKQTKSMEIMDVSADAVDALLRKLGYPAVLIHGHTHRPARHAHKVDGHAITRQVLSDWRGQGAPVLVMDGPISA